MGWRRGVVGVMGVGRSVVDGVEKGCGGCDGGGEECGGWGGEWRGRHQSLGQTKGVFAFFNVILFPILCADQDTQSYPGNYCHDGVFPSGGGGEKFSCSGAIASLKWQPHLPDSWSTLCDDTLHTMYVKMFVTFIAS